MSRGPINQHTGLRIGEHKQRYRRRHQAPHAQELAELGETATAADDELDLDFHWATCEVCRGMDEVLTPVDLLVQRIVGELVPLSRLPLSGGETTVAGDAAPAGRDPDALVEDLARFVAFLEAPEAMPQLLARPDVRAAQRAVRETAGRSPVLAGWINRNPGAATMLVAMAPFWIRPIESWSPATDATAADVGPSLVTHLLQRYAVPSSLHQPWRQPWIPALKWVLWLVLLGQGASLRRAGVHFGWRIEGRFHHHLLDAPDGIEPGAAAMWAEVARLGGQPRHYERLVAHPAFVVDPTDAHRSGYDEGGGEEDARAYRRFWLETATWLIGPGDELGDGDTALVLDWAVHRHTEERVRPPEAGQTPFSWRGRTAAAAVEAARAHGAQLQRARWRHGPPIAWSSAGRDATITDADGTWTMQELCSVDALADESLAMHHCVATYAHRCARGDARIYSLTRDGVRQVTVEVDRQGRPVQIRGPYNRLPTPRELEVVTRWAGERT